MILICDLIVLYEVALHFTTNVKNEMTMKTNTRRENRKENMKTKENSSSKCVIEFSIFWL